MADLAGTNYTDLFAEQHLKDATGGSVEAWKNAVGQQNTVADEALARILSGSGSAAAQQQKLGLAKAGQQMQAQALSRGANPGNERAAMYAGANAQTAAIGNAASLRAQEEQVARAAQLQARQFGAQSYGQQAQFNSANQQALWALKQRDLDRDAGNDAASALGNSFGGVASTVGGIAGIASDERLKRDIRDAGLDTDAIKSAAERARGQGGDAEHHGRLLDEAATRMRAPRPDYSDRLGREPDTNGRAEAIRRVLGDAELTAPWRRGNDEMYERIDRGDERVAELSRELGDGALPPYRPTPRPAPTMPSDGALPHYAVSSPRVESPRFSLEQAYGRDIISDEHSKQQISELEMENADLKRKVSRFLVGPGGEAKYTSATGENVSGRMPTGWQQGDVGRVSYRPDDPDRSVSIRNESGDPNDRGFHEGLHRGWDEPAEPSRAPSWRGPLVDETPPSFAYHRPLSAARGGVVSDERSKQQIESLSSQLQDERLKNASSDMSHLDPVTRMYPMPRDPMVLARDDNQQFAGARPPMVLAGDGNRQFASPPEPSGPPINEKHAQFRMPIIERGRNDTDESMRDEEAQAVALSRGNDARRQAQELSPWDRMIADRQKKQDERDAQARQQKGWGMLSSGLRQAFGAAR